jgi:hypothetical protein
VQHEHHFVVVRADRRGELPSTYLQKFALVGRNGLRQLGFGPAGSAHLFKSQTEAEDIARRLRRRLSMADFDFAVEAVPPTATPSAPD